MRRTISSKAVVSFDSGRLRRGARVAALVALGAIGCGSKTATEPGGSGGAGVGTGGATGSGGAPAGSGGGTGTGGGSATGGGTGTGGAGTGGATGSGGVAATGGRTGTGGAVGSGGLVGSGGMMMGSGGAAGQAGITGTCATQTNYDAVATGFASVGGSTTGGGNATPRIVTSTSAFNTAAGGTGAAVIEVMGKLSGTFTIGSNKTIIGMCGAELDGHVQISGSSNVIVRNLRVVGLNCTDSTADCENGADSITVDSQSDHLWFDHCDISNGSDGNLDITQASDFVTVSWTKFSYSGLRAGGHQFSNLIGASDTDTSDAGHLHVTWHHDWWAANVGERMPRVRFGQVHIFNNLYTATGNNTCVELGVSANVLTENNAFIGVEDAIDTLDYSNAASILVSRGNLYQAVSGMLANKGTAVFTPSYTYGLDLATSIPAIVMAGAGVH